MTTRLYIFDADGTLRCTLIPGQPAPHAADQWALAANVRDRLARIPWGPGGPFLGVASNQDQVGYGLLSAATAERLLREMVAAAAGAITPAPAIRFCPHPEGAGCLCRKPAPGMLLDLMDHFRVPARETLFIGDAERDREAARAAGIAFVHADRFFGR